VEHPERAQSERLLYRPAEAADRLAMSLSRLYELMAAGEIRSVACGRSRRVPAEALSEFVSVLEAKAGKADANENETDDRRSER